MLRPAYLFRYLTLGLLCAGTLAHAKTLSPTATVGLQAYVAKIAKAVESGAIKPRLFVDLGFGGKAPLWKEFTDQATLDAACKNGECPQQAWIYFDQGHCMLAAFTLTSPSGDWVNNIDDYFYLSGQLAKNHSELRRFGATDPKDPKGPTFLVEVVRSRYFDKAGKLIGADKPLVYKVKEKDKELIEGAQFAEGEWPTYKSTKDLPMAAALEVKKAAKKLKAKAKP